MYSKIYASLCFLNDLQGFGRPFKSRLGVILTSADQTSFGGEMVKLPSNMVTK